jgi:5'-nucleotidase
LINRRDFLRQGLLIGGGLLLSPPGASALASEKKKRLTILHTNDWHSRIEPFPMDGGRNQGLGGAARRAELIRKIREEEEHVVLLDSGDIFQGTPYFNFYGGELEFRLMSEMGYDCATLGNHDFDAGLSGLEKQLPHAGFDILSANYDFSETTLAGRFAPFKILKKGKIKIGIIGVGIELEGLVPAHLYGKVKYLDPVERTNHYARLLREEYQCHLIICLSHLGYRYTSGKISDHVLARESENVDIVLGGHTHTFLEAPDEVINKKGNSVLISQAGWGGILLGRLDISFSSSNIAGKPQSSMVKVS